jgi:hypothetical protein
MTKQAVFLVTDNGVDGRDKESIIFASLDEKERDNWLANNKNRNYFSSVDRVVDLESESKNALGKLNQLDLLALNSVGNNITKP